MNYRFLSPAFQELADAAEFYDERVPGLGADFIDEVDAAIARILQFPEAWRNIGDGYRGCNLRRFPYTLIYTIVEKEEVILVSVFHQSRKPRSWRSNL